MIQMIPLILENSHFPCIIAILLKKILWEIEIFLTFLNPSTHLVYDLSPLYYRLSNTESHFYKDAYHMFCIYTILHQIVLVDDTIL